MRLGKVGWLVMLAACGFDLADVPMTDAGLASTRTGTPPRAGETHRTCSRPFPPTALEPTVATDGVGRPAFDLYRDTRCEDGGDNPVCDAASWQASERCESCVLGDSTEGICASARAQQLEDPAVLSTQSGRCYAVVSTKAKRRVCPCSGRAFAGVDCREWPFVKPSGPGQLCAYHADCEPGLMCKALPYAPGVGLAGACLCPEAEAEPLAHNVPGCEAAQ